MMQELFDDLYANIEREAIDKKTRNIFAELAKVEKPKLILYGAGGNCESAMFLCSWMNAVVECVCDSKAKGTFVYKNHEYNIISLEELLQKHKDAYVLITSWKYEQEIYDILLERKFPEERIFFLRCPWMLSVEEFQEKYLQGYRWAYSYFEDANSKKHILDRIRLLLLGFPCPADSLYQNGYFGYTGIKVEENETYLDGGAYTGDSAEEFILHMRHNAKQYKRVFAFEPDKEICRIAEENLQQYKDVEVIPAGLWSKTTELQFFKKEEQLGSEIGICNAENAVSVPVVSLDDYFERKAEDSWPTIIKLDVEGSEKEVLLGATKIIQLKKPKLVICAYHKPEDIYELPQTIMQLRSDYTFKLWQIGESFFDTILYAV